MQGAFDEAGERGLTEFLPGDEGELRDIVAAAAGERQPLEVIGAGSKRALGRPLQLPHSLVLSRFSGIVAYEPSELVLTAKAATPLALLEAALGENNQMLAFEPPAWGRLLDGADSGGAGGGQTVGGILACNLSGPRRFKAGAARDHFLGFRAVSGRGEVFKAGGKVVKNVTGYDLCKLMAGSYGTLAVLSEVTVKVLPRPEKTRTVLIFGPDAERAVAAMTAALAAPHEVGGAAHLPADIAAVALSGASRAATLIRVEGPGPSVDARVAALRDELRDFGPADLLLDGAARAPWRALADVNPVTDEQDRAVWRISVAPQKGPDVAAAIATALDAHVFFDWGGGLLWCSVAESAAEGGAETVRAATKSAGGHATLVRASAELRRRIAVFEPQPPALAALSRRIKEGFDPKRILNPGRMYRDI